MKKSTPNYFVLWFKINNHNSSSFIAKILDNEDFSSLGNPFQPFSTSNLFSCINNIIQGHLASLNHKFKPILKIQTISLPLQYSKIQPNYRNSSLWNFSYFFLHTLHMLLSLFSIINTIKQQTIHFLSLSPHAIKYMRQTLTINILTSLSQQ